MAGIGFELKKIYTKEDSLIRIAAGAGYSTIITIGPTLIVIGAILLLYWALGFSSVDYADRELLSSTILYVFIFAAILTAPGNAVFSRYIADKIFQEKYDDILPSYYSGLLFHVLPGTILALPVMYRLITVGGVPLLFVLSSYGLWMANLILFFSITYLYATKDYKIVAMAFLAGMATAVGSSLLFHFLLGVMTTHAILYGLTLGSFLIAILEFSYIRIYYPASTDNYVESLTYVYRYKQIFAANLFYFTGLYVHNFVFWTTPMHITVANTYISTQSYDMASCLALFTNISTITIFTVMAETKFHEKFQKYTESVIGSTYREIKMNKRIMFRLLIQQISHVFSIQIIITAILFLLIIIFGPLMGFGGMTLKIYPALAVAYLVIFLMYANIVYLFYFNDNFGAMCTAFLFLVSTFVASCYTKTLAIEFYGLGALIGAIIGWTFGFFRIRYMEAIFDAHIFCSQKVVNEQNGKKKKHIVYERTPGKKQDKDLW